MKLRPDLGFVWECVKKSFDQRGVKIEFKAIRRPQYDSNAPEHYRRWCDKQRRDSDLAVYGPAGAPPVEGHMVHYCRPWESLFFEVGKHYLPDLALYEAPKTQLAPDDFTPGELNRLFGGQEVHWSREELRRNLVYFHCIPG